MRIVRLARPGALEMLPMSPMSSGPHNPENVRGGWRDREPESPPLGNYPTKMLHDTLIAHLECAGLTILWWFGQLVSCCQAEKIRSNQLQVRATERYSACSSTD